MFEGYVQIRALGRNSLVGVADAGRQLVDLADALHNIPQYAAKPEIFSEENLLSELAGHHLRFPGARYDLVKLYRTHPDDGAGPRTVADEIRDYLQVPKPANDLIQRLTGKSMDVRCPHCDAPVPVEINT